MLSASLIFYIQKSRPFCLPEHSQISHLFALSLCDFFFSLTCSFHQPVHSFLGYSFQEASLWGLLPQRASHIAASLLSAESGAQPTLVWPLLYLLVPISVSPQPGLGAWSVSSHPGDKQVKINLLPALQAPPAVGGCDHRPLGQGHGQEGVAHLPPSATEGSWSQGRERNAEGAEGRRWLGGAAPWSRGNAWSPDGSGSSRQVSSSQKSPAPDSP